jgi:hypothetical protein
MINEYFRYPLLSDQNTSFVNVNASKPVWWLNIDPIKRLSQIVVGHPTRHSRQGGKVDSHFKCNT